MAPRIEIVNSTIPSAGISRLRSLKFGQQLEQEIAPQFSGVFKFWLDGVARKVALDWPRRSGSSATEIASSARVRGYASLDAIRGYFLVSSPIASNEYGTGERHPQNAKMLAIPILDGLFPDGTPKRLGPNSWRYLKTFVYKSKRTGNSYIAYRAGDKLKILYLLVDKTKGLKELRKFRNTFDKNLPELYAAIELIVQQAVVNVYIKQFNDALDSIDGNLIMRKPPTIIPDATTHAGRLVPKY